MLLRPRMTRSRRSILAVSSEKSSSKRTSGSAPGNGIGFVSAVSAGQGKFPPATLFFFNIRSVSWSIVARIWMGVGTYPQRIRIPLCLPVVTAVSVNSGEDDGCRSFAVVRLVELAVGLRWLNLRESKKGLLLWEL
ncbi:hypothetical protein NL676_008058 [Syzygium grande]|nr:hypothetical protein NL676_008058 [Syzygium grande]